MRIVLFFGEMKTSIYVFWLPSTEEVLVELHRKDAEAQELVLVLSDLGLHTFRKLQLATEFDWRLMPYISYEDDRLVFKKGDVIKLSSSMNAMQPA